MSVYPDIRTWCLIRRETRERNRSTRPATIHVHGDLSPSGPNAGRYFCALCDSFEPEAHFASHPRDRHLSRMRSTEKALIAASEKQPVMRGGDRDSNLAELALDREQATGNWRIGFLSEHT